MKSIPYQRVKSKEPYSFVHSLKILLNGYFMIEYATKECLGGSFASVVVTLNLLLLYTSV